MCRVIQSDDEGTADESDNESEDNDDGQIEYRHDGLIDFEFGVCSRLCLFVGACVVCWVRVFDVGTRVLRGYT